MAYLSLLILIRKADAVRGNLESIRYSEEYILFIITIRENKKRSWQRI